MMQTKYTPNQQRIEIVDYWPKGERGFDDALERVNKLLQEGWRVCRVAPMGMSLSETQQPKNKKKNKSKRLKGEASLHGAFAAAIVVLAYEPEEEKDEFDVILTDFGVDKIAVMKEVRALTGLGLKEAKNLVENAPNYIKEGVSRYEAKGILEKLRLVGATVELQ